MSQEYIEYKIFADPDHFEIIIAFMSQMAFDSFQENDDHMVAWITKDNVTADLDQQLKDTLIVPCTIESHSVKPQNWNEVWESQFSPVIIDDFCSIRADFHEVKTKCTYDIVINPKMAFGTGHHETTEMMIRFMRELVLDGSSVFDFGTGTGILAVLAHKMGAKKIIAIDNDENAIENTFENININTADGIEVSNRDISTFSNQPYDIILANVNRKAILDSLTYLSQMMKYSSTLLISGILFSDKKIVYQALKDNQLSMVKVMQKGEWLCLKIAK